MPVRRIDTEAEIAWIRYQELANSGVLDTPAADHIYLGFTAEGAFIKFSDGNVYGPLISAVLVQVNAAPAGDAKTVNFIEGAGIRVFPVQSSPTDPMDLTIVGAGTPRVVTGADTITPADHIVQVDSTGGAFTLSLDPALSFVAGQLIWFKKINAGNPVPVDADGAELIDGASAKNLTDQWESFGIWTDGNEWFVVPRAVAAPAGAAVLNVNTTPVGNITTGEDNLITYTVPANTLTTNGQYLEFQMAGTFAASLNNKRVRAYFGGALLLDTGALAITTAGDWAITGRVVRTGAATQRCVVTITTSQSVLMGSADYTDATEDLTGTVLLRATGEATATDDVIEKFMLTTKYG